MGGRWSIGEIAILDVLEGAAVGLGEPVAIDATARDQGKRFNCRCDGRI